MKKITLLFAALALAFAAAAQNPTAYFMEGSTFRSQLNPAFAPLQGYVNIPGIGGLDINMVGNLSLDRILYPRDGKLVTLLDGSVTADEALSGLKPVNMLGNSSRVNIIGFGAFTRNHKNFWSFDLNLRGSADLSLPYSLFEFLKKGNSTPVRDIGVTAEAYLEAAFNYSFPLLDDRLYVGVRGKFLMGLARARLNYERFDVTLGEDEWRIDAVGEMEVNMAGAEVNTYFNDNGLPVFQPDDLDFSPTSPAGYGFAIDLGATYDILPDLQASLAVNDLGFISWGKKNNIKGRSLKSLSFTGTKITANGTEPQPDFDMNVLEFEQTESQSSARMLNASINAGIEYNVWRHRIGIGALYTARIWEYKTLHNLTASVNIHPVRWFTITGSYSFLDNQGHAVGLALNLCPSWINFYLATDMLVSKHTPQFVPIEQSIMNLSLGIGIPIGRRSHRIPAYAPQRGR